ncbi:hypothetical protein TNCV_4096451 [Trichonephila clavipes]|nr:hypothetical protein TNCV_4096451 [Trichonephila clavipes]
MTLTTGLPRPPELTEWWHCSIAFKYSTLTREPPHMDNVVAISSIGMLWIKHAFLRETLNLQRWLPVGHRSKRII